MPNDPKYSSTQSEYQSPTGCFLRLFWMGAGNLALVLTAFWNAQSAGWSVADIIFAVLPLLMIGFRYIDIVRYQGMTADGDAPATMAHLKRYALTVVLVAAALWAGSRALRPGFSAGS
ncbi:MAG TPA: hypothetical protein VFK09_05155 [Gemmatimonadales bacterium]|nr:hypothetical protein [Gemmatimonadales bacterium]